jgi:hypothetical protein
MCNLYSITKGQRAKDNLPSSGAVDGWKSGKRLTLIMCSKITARAGEKISPALLFPRTAFTHDFHCCRGGDIW